MSPTAAPLRLVHDRSGFRGRLQGAAALVGRRRCRDRAARGRHPGRRALAAATRLCWSTPSASMAWRPTSMAELELTQAEELKAAFDAIHRPAQRERLEARPSRVRSYHEAQKQACGLSWTYRDEDGTLLGQKVTPLDRVGIYVPGGKAAYPSSRADERHPRPCGRRGRDHHGGAHAPSGEEPAGAQRAGAGRRLRGRRDPCLHHRWRAGRGRAGLRHRHRAQGGQDHRPRQRLCGQRQEARVRHRSAST
jgi:hypothetical protein